MFDHETQPGRLRLFFEGDLKSPLEARKCPGERSRRKGLKCRERRPIPEPNEHPRLPTPSVLRTELLAYPKLTDL